jgi:hypothetical protein
MSWSHMDPVRLVLPGLLHFLLMLPEDLQSQLQGYLPPHTQGEQRHLGQGLFLGISSYWVNTDIESVTD